MYTQEWTIWDFIVLIQLAQLINICIKILHDKMKSISSDHSIMHKVLYIIIIILIVIIID